LHSTVDTANMTTVEWNGAVFHSITYLDSGMGKVVKLADVMRKIRKYAFQMKYPYFLEKENETRNHRLCTHDHSTNRAAWQEQMTTG
jgi:hypothetical protein